MYKHSLTCNLLMVYVDIHDESNAYTDGLKPHGQYSFHLLCLLLPNVACGPDKDEEVALSAIPGDMGTSVRVFHSRKL